MKYARAWNCSSLSLICLLATLSVLAGGCASGGSALAESGGQTSQTSLCTTARCIHKAAMEPHYERCIDALFSQSARLSQREAVFAEFGYPFSDADGYFTWRRMGGTGPGPWEWCRHYAADRVANPYGRPLSLR